MASYNTLYLNYLLSTFDTNGHNTCTFNSVYGLANMGSSFRHYRIWRLNVFQSHSNKIFYTSSKNTSLSNANNLIFSHQQLYYIVEFSQCDLMSEKQNDLCKHHYHDGTSQCKTVLKGKQASKQGKKKQKNYCIRAKLGFFFWGVCTCVVFLFHL